MYLNNYLVLFFMLVFLIFSLPAVAQLSRDYNIQGWGKDPFISPIELENKLGQMRRQETDLESRELSEEEIRRQIREEINNFKITGILKGENKLAIIDGEIYQERNSVRGIMIKEIEDNFIIFKKDDFEFRVQFPEE